MYNNLFGFRPKPLIFGLMAMSFIVGASVYMCKRYSQPQTLYASLDFYGFKTPAQKQALQFLMQKAGIKDAGQLLNRKAKNANALGRLILDFTKRTQDKFTIRTGQQERWDVQTSDWMKNVTQQPKILEALETLNMMNDIHATFKKCDAICVLGASRRIMSSRLKYASDLFLANELQSSWLILLAGERYVTPDKNGVLVDGSEQDLASIAGKLGKNITTLTETDLMKAEYQGSKLYNKLPTVVIDTPRRNLPRPTTETTVAEFCDWLKKHKDINVITFVSNQPHVKYQEAIIAQVLKRQNMRLKFEVIGPKYNVLVVNNNADKINYVLQALGSQIWAITPAVLDRLKLDISDPQLRAEYMELYKKQPLIYNNLNTKFGSDAKVSTITLGLSLKNKYFFGYDLLRFDRLK